MKSCPPVLLLLVTTLQLVLICGVHPASAIVVLVRFNGGARVGHETNDGGQITKRDALFPQDGSGSFVNNYNDRTVNVTDNLESALQNLTSHTIVRFEPGNYTLEEFVLVRDVTNITLEADGDEGGVSIQCIEEAGLAFINVSYLSIRNITVDGCGFTGSDIDSTVDILDDIVNIFYVIPRVVRIAVLIGHCENITMESVTIKNTRGFGLVGINVIGNSLLSDVVFFNNTNAGVCIPIQFLNLSAFIGYDNRYQLGGAAAFMYFDYHDQARYQGNKFSLEIQNCKFTLNAECSYVYLNIIRQPGEGESRFINNIGYRLGGSGSLAIVLAQLQYGVDFSTMLSSFVNNSGIIGAGSLVSLFTGVQNTHVMFDDCLFDNNSVYFANDLRLPENVEYSLRSSEKNTTISFINSNFTNKPATTIGTLTILSNYYTPQNDIRNVIKVYIDRCFFSGNKAILGAAIIVYEYKISGFNVGIQVSIKDTDFIGNEIVTADEDATITISQSAGIVDIRNVNLTLQGNCSFIDNTGTALRAESSLVGVNGNITFLRNIGINGGALHLVSYAYLIMNRNSSVYFIENEARIGGGAIYVNENGINSYLVGGFADCFVHFTYDNFILCENCSDLNSSNVYVKFLGNVAPFGSGSMVYGSSLATCPWAQNLRSENPKLSVFEILDKQYKNVFDFDQTPNDPALVRSTSRNLRIKLEDSDNNVTEVFPGEIFYATISALDDFNNTISNNIVAAFASSETSSESSSKQNETVLIPFLGSNNFAVLNDSAGTRVPIKIRGTENQNVSLVIFSADGAGRAQEQIDVMLYSCGFGFKFDTSQYICACDPSLQSTGFDITCNIDTQEIIVPDGVWIGPFADQGEEIVVRECFFRYCKPGQRNIVIESPDETTVNFNVQCDDSMNRVGFLCGSCAEGYSAVLGTRRCRRCSNWYILLYPIFIAIGILAIFALRYLNITITAGFINGAIFYSNIVSIYGTTLVPGETLTNGAIVLVSFPTLNLGFETCLHDKMKTLEKVLWQLSFPFYLFILMGITTLLARTKCLKFNRSAGLGTIQAFATLLILCYVSVLEACIELIGFRRIVTTSGSSHVQWLSDPSIRYFGKEHGTLGFIAYLILFLYIIPLPFFLMFPSALYRSKYLGKFKPIYDAFWNPFKRQYRFFLGFRLIFRWIPFAVASFVQPPTNIFITNFLLILLFAFQINLQPFRSKWLNIIDSVFLLNLILLFLGSIYFWSEYNDSNSNRSLTTRNSYIYSNIFIILVFLLMLAIVVHHVILRFPKLKSFIGRLWNKTPLNKVYNFPSDKEATDADPGNSINGAREMTSTELDVSVDTNKHYSIKPQRAVVTSSELREPLLESGTSDLYEVNPSSTSERVINTFFPDST